MENWTTWSPTTSRTACYSPSGWRILATVLDRRQERSERRREHLAELHKRATEADAAQPALRRHRKRRRRSRAPGLKERIAGLKAIRDQARADAERAQAALDKAGNQAITPAMLKTFARTARKRMRLEGGGYRRDHLRALAQRVEVADTEVRIMGSKCELLRTLVAASSGKSACRSSEFCPKWRTRQIRTCGLHLRRVALYPAELRVHLNFA